MSKTPFPTTPKFFVYGTLKKGFHNHRWIEPFVEKIQPATVGGFVLAVSGVIPFALPDGASFVKGELITVKADKLQAATIALDTLESEGSFYFRREVRTTNGELCSMYVMPQRFPGLTIIGSEYGPHFLEEFDKYYEDEQEEEEEEESIPESNKGRWM